MRAQRLISEEQFKARRIRKARGPKFNHNFDPVVFVNNLTKLHDPNKVMSFS